MTNWLLTGGTGMLGRDLVSVLSADNDVQLSAPARAELDITDSSSVRAAVAGADVVVNSAAWTDVDRAEADEAGAVRVNGAGAANVALACAESRAVLVHVSTDYVFSGDAFAPYREDALIGPINAYGRSKAAGEAAVRTILPDAGFIVRTAWLYGEHGNSFVAKMLRAAAEREFIDVVSDQRGQPTWSFPLAVQIAALGKAAAAGRAAPGTYHGTATGSATWYTFAHAIFELSGRDPDRIRPTTSDRFARPARRPAYSILAHGNWASADLAPLPEWRPMLAQALDRRAFAEILESVR